MRMKRKVAAGGIVIRNLQSIHHALLIQDAKNKEWKFPKGHVDPGESFDETALREVEEETGVKGAILTTLPSVNYQFINRKGVTIDKTVHWFLMKYLGEGVQTHPHEVMDVQWVVLGEVYEVLTFDEDRKLFEKTLTILDDYLND